jgi:hypothetical protein
MRKKRQRGIRPRKSFFGLLDPRHGRIRKPKSYNRFGKFAARKKTFASPNRHS